MGEFREITLNTLKVHVFYSVELNLSILDSVDDVLARFFGFGLVTAKEKISAYAQYSPLMF